MKIIIDIPESKYHSLMKCFENDVPLGKIDTAIINSTPLPECKDCKFFEYDSVAQVDGVPLILGHELCKKWGDGCKTKEDGYCFMFEAKEETEDAKS